MQKEYIERSEQESILKKRYYELAGKRPDFYAGYMTAFHIIEDDIPNAADVAEVVRCKDCRHMTLEMGYVRFCNVWERPNGMGDDGFCNYGELRADA